MLEQLVWDVSTGAAEGGHRLFEVHGVSEDNRGDNEIQSAGAQALVIEGAVLD